MRPIKLIISAFGPYAECETIDFEKLGNKGLYLITGDTGAGRLLFLTQLHMFYMESPVERPGLRLCLEASMQSLMFQLL